MDQDKDSKSPALVEEDEEQSGVEAEREEVGLVIDRPFDPEKIKVKTKAALVGSIVKWFRSRGN